MKKTDQFRPPTRLRLFPFQHHHTPAEVRYWLNKFFIKRLLWCFWIGFIGSGASSHAQIITPTLQIKQKEFPLIFPANEAGNSVLLFFAPERTSAKTFLFQLAVLNEANQLLKTDSVTLIKAFAPGDKHLTPLCHYADKTIMYALFKVGERSIYQVNIDPVSYKISAQAIGELNAREHLLGGFTLRNSTVILTRGPASEDPRSLNVYQLKGDSFNKTTFHKDLPDFFSRSYYNPLLVQNGADMWPNKAVHPDKIMADGDQIYILQDKTPNIYAQDVLKLHLVTIDLQADTLYTQVLDYPNHGTVVPGASGGSYIFESKLFQVYFDYDKFGLLVRNLPDQTLLFEQYMSGDDSLFLIQSPIDFWSGRKLNKSNARATDLLDRLRSVSPYIYVKRLGSDLVLGMGGHKKALRGGTNSGPNDPNLATPVRPAGEKNVVFYSAMAESARSLSNQNMHESAVTRIYHDLLIPKNGVFRNINGHSKYLYYDDVQANQPFRSLIILDMADH